MGFHVTELNFWLRNENPNSIETNNIQTLSYINILNTLSANKIEKEILINYFKKNKVSFRSAETALKKLRNDELNF